MILLYNPEDHESKPKLQKVITLGKNPLSIKQNSPETSGYQKRYIINTSFYRMPFAELALILLSVTKCSLLLKLLIMNKKYFNKSLKVNICFVNKIKSF